MKITSDLVRRLVDTQFPEYRELPIWPVEKSGHDNRTFHLGDEYLVRLPSDIAYAEHVALELKWLPYLQEHLDFEISAPIASGKPAEGYPLPWSIGRWIIGETVTHENVADEKQLAQDLNAWLSKLQQVPAKEGPAAGKHNFYRGGDLSVYDQETQEALTELLPVLGAEKIQACRSIWQEALSSSWKQEPVWVHGDVAVGNLLVRDGRLSALIDFGTCAVGDPACDYVMAWTFFDQEARQIFLAGLDDAVISRAKGWALWKALITYVDDNTAYDLLSRVVLTALLEEYV